MATFHKRTWVNNSAPYLNANNLNGLEGDIQTFGDDIVTEVENHSDTYTTNKLPFIESDDEVSYEVTESTSIFALPENVTDYSDTTYYIICTINGEETTDFILGEQSFVQILTLTTAISSGTVVIRALKFKESFLSFIANNMPTT